MTLSPFRRDQFDEQKSYMDTGFHKLGEQIDAVESNLTKKFDVLDKKVDVLDKKVDNLDKKVDRLEVEMSQKFDKAEDQFVELRQEIPRHMGMLREGFRDDLKLAIEFLTDRSGGSKKEFSFGGK